MKLLNIDQNAKTVKGQSKGYMPAVLYLAPHKLSGDNVCPDASSGCIAACLNTAGRGRFSNVQDARINRTRLFFDSPVEFMLMLHKELRAFQAKARKAGLIPCVRLNGTSDLKWEMMQGRTKAGKFESIFEQFQDVQFYDYTKTFDRLAPSRYIPNYHLTFSASENNQADQRAALSLGFNVAMVFHSADFTALSFGKKKFAVINGDANDLRFLDPSPVVIALKPKGPAKKDQTGFVI